MQNLSSIQWAAILGAVALVAWGRLPQLKEWLGTLFGRLWPSTSAAEPTDADRVAAYQVLVGHLEPTTAVAVWTQIRPTGTAAVTAVPEVKP